MLIDSLKFSASGFAQDINILHVISVTLRFTCVFCYSDSDHSRLNLLVTGPSEWLTLFDTVILSKKNFEQKLLPSYKKVSSS